jgi:hypothetical protein
MTSFSTHSPAPRLGRMAGIGYLILIAAGIFAHFFVRSGLVVPADAAATAANILAREQLFRLGLAGDLVMLLCDVGLTVAFFVLFRQVNRDLALLAASLRLVHAAIYGANLFNLLLALQLLAGDASLAALPAAQLEALALLFVKGHDTGYLIGLVFFGVYCLILGRLVFRSGFMPRVLGVLLVVAGAGYLVDSFAQFLYTGYQGHAELFQMVVFLPAFIGELAFALWLLIKNPHPPASQ